MPTPAVQAVRSASIVAVLTRPETARARSSARRARFPADISGAPPNVGVADRTCYVRRAVALTEAGAVNLLADGLDQLFEPWNAASS